MSEASGWFVADWGVITVGHIRDEAIMIQPSERIRFSCRMVAHDGDPISDSTFKEKPFILPEELINEKSGND